MGLSYSLHAPQTAFNVYYQTVKGNGKKLHHILVEDVQDYEDARYEVMNMLHKNMEDYSRPVMVVINGNKV